MDEEAPPRRGFFLVRIILGDFASVCFHPGPVRVWRLAGQRRFHPVTLGIAMLEKLLVEDWQVRLHQDFTLQLGAGQRLVLCLTSVTPLSAHQGTYRRQPYSLEFRGPPQPLLAQGTYRLCHAAMGDLEIFLVPIGRSETAVGYEAIFT